MPAVAGWTAVGAGALGVVGLSSAWFVKRDIVGRPAGDSGVGGSISMGQTLNIAGLIGLGVAAVGLSTYALVPSGPSCGDVQ